MEPFKEVLSIVVPESNALPVMRSAPMEALGELDIRIKILTMGYCGRDKSILTGRKGAVPGRIGHEGCGIVVEKGTAVKDIEVGELVIVFPFINGHNIGYDWPDGGMGIFSTYPVIPSEAVFRTGRKSATEEEAMRYSLVEPFSGVSRGLKRGRITERDCLVILGAGPIGCAQAILARYMNPALKIFLVDTLHAKLRTAEKKTVPADFFMSPAELLISHQELLNPFSNLLIMHSNPFKESVKDAFTFAPSGSEILFFRGVYDWTEQDNSELGFSLNPKKMHYEEYSPAEQNLSFHGKNLTLSGSRGFTRDDFKHAADLILGGKIDPLPLVTKVICFDYNILENLRREGASEHNLKIQMIPCPDY